MPAGPAAVSGNLDGGNLELDVRTIYMMNAVVYLMLHGIIWVSLSRYQSQRRHVALWSVSGMVSAAGVVFLGSQGLMPDWAVAVFGQVLMVLGNYGRQYTLHSLNAPVSRQWIWGQGIFNLIYLLINGWLFVSGASYAQMMLVFFAFYTVNGLDYFQAGLALRRQHGSAGARSVQWSGLVLSISLGIKCLSLWAGWGAAGLYDAGWDQLVLFAGQFLGISLMNFGFMQILVHRFQQQRAQAEHDLLTQREQTARAEQQSLDLTHLLREREEMIRQMTLSNKTAGMGALVSGIAHEVNQPLTTIVLKSELIETCLTDPPDLTEVRRLCGLIRDDSHRAGSMIRTLRGMFTIGRSGFGQLDFVELLRGMTDIVHKRASQMGITIELVLPAALRMTGDSTQLQQVVLNLLNNAIQAIAKAQPAVPRVTLTCSLQKGWIELRVQDNGCGIDPQVRDDVFGLFKSPQSRDMGVGLWLSRSVVQSHGGTLDFESTPGQGAVFLLRLPAREDAIYG